MKTKTRVSRPNVPIRNAGAAPSLAAFEHSKGTTHADAPDAPLRGGRDLKRS